MWDERYSAEHYIYGKEPNLFLKENSGTLPMGNILCLAEGEGRNAVFLARQGYSVTAVDASSTGLKKAQRLAEENEVQVEFIHQDLADFDLGYGQWDGIVSIFCHLPPAIRRNVHSKVVAGLSNNGVLLLEAYTPEQLLHGTGGPATAEMTMTAALLSEEFAGLHFSHLDELEREVIEGTHHTGLGAVVQAIARKV